MAERTGAVVVSFLITARTGIEVIETTAQEVVNCLTAARFRSGVEVAETTAAAVVKGRSTFRIGMDTAEVMAQEVVRFLTVPAD